MTISRYPNQKKETSKPAPKSKNSSGSKAKRKTVEEATWATRSSSEKGPRMAAINYVNQGLKALKLSPRQEADLKDKLIPSVERTIANERNRTLMRVKGVYSREEKARMAKAQKKILGGK